LGLRTIPIGKYRLLKSKTPDAIKARPAFSPIRNPKCLFVSLVGNPTYGQWDSTEPIDVLAPIAFKSRVNNAVMSGRMVEPFFISNDTNVR
jgi:hypothetical protein